MVNYFAAFYSDPHFGHARIIEYSSRPFSSIENMNAALVINYNTHIHPNDTVLWLGDCFLCKVEDAKAIMSSLNGTKILVKGNHDKSKTAMCEIGFTAVADELTLSIAGRKVIARHVPQYIKGAVTLHGHTHSKERRNNNRIHVGVDAWDYRPAMYEEVEELVKEIYV